MKFGIPLAILFTLLLSSACSPSPGADPLNAPEGVQAVNPRFREFYNHLGGVKILGPAISDMREFEHYQLQFTSAALMVYDRQAPPNQRFRLAPLGLELGVQEPPVPPPVGSQETYINGHIIYEKIYPLYQQLGGARFVGRPITEAKYNPDQQRIEQYFENLGFYISDNDPEGVVYLMAYGAYKCDRYCRYRAPLVAIPERAVIDTAKLNPVFNLAISRLGVAFTGTPVSDPFFASDGSEELILQNLVLYIDPQYQERVFARPVVEQLGISPQPLVARIDDPRMDFFVLEGDLGHNVPVIFTDYLAQHGGLDIAGPPISEIFPLTDGSYRQCFRNLCVDYVPQATDSKVRLASLGWVYKTRFYADPIVEDQFTDSQSLQTLTIRTWEAKPMITSQEIQQIFVGIFEDQIPLKNMEPELRIELPDGESSFEFPPTNENGISHLDLPAIQARNGTIIPYDVCLQNLLRESACVSDSFLIWGNP